jgi:hypothetical protein
MVPLVRKLALTLIALVLVLPLSASALSLKLPDTLPDVSDWQDINGEFTLPRVEARYDFYVNPVRGAIYQMMHYRVRFLKPVFKAEWSYPPSDKLVWNDRPGEHIPLRMFERLEATPEAAARWRELPQDSAEYKTELLVGAQLLAVHRAIRLGEEPRW